MSKQAIFFKTLSQSILIYLGSFSLFPFLQEKVLPFSSKIQIFIFFLLTFSSLLFTTVLSEILNFILLGLTVLKGFMGTIIYLVTIRFVIQWFPAINYSQYKVFRVVIRMTTPIFKILNPTSSRLAPFLTYYILEFFTFSLNPCQRYISLVRDKLPHLEDLYYVYANLLENKLAYT